MGANKKNVTISVSRDVHRDFKIENVKNGSDMSEAIENFMINYIKASRKLNLQKEEHEQ